MPLYELFCISTHNPSSPANLRQLVKSIATQVHATGGVVRDFRSLGRNLTLPTRMKRNQQFHTHGDHFTMSFDTSPIILSRINESLRQDPMVIRWMLLKKGSAIKDLNPPPAPSIRELHDDRQL